MFQSMVTGLLGPCGTCVQNLVERERKQEPAIATTPLQETVVAYARLQVSSGESATMPPVQVK